MLAGGLTTGQGLSSMVTFRGLTLGEKIKALSASAVAHASPDNFDVAASPQVPSDKRASTEWNVITLPNDDASFTMDGVIPMDVVVDTEAKRVTSQTLG